MSRSTNVFSGIWTALITPFNADGSVDWAMLDKLLLRQCEAGISGLVLTGSTGETATLSAQEKISIFRRARSLVGDKLPLMAGTGGSNTQQVVELSKLALDAGMDALLVVNPPYVKANPQGLVAHYAQLSELGIPVCLYHHPGRTGQRMSAETIAEITALKNIVCIKEGTEDLSFFMELRQKTNAKIFAGDDYMLLPTLAVGGAGCISTIGNLFPNELLALYRYAQEGNWEKARKLNDLLFPIMKTLFCESNPVPLKAALFDLGLCNNVLRLPLAPISTENHKKLREVYKKTTIALESFC